MRRNSIAASLLACSALALTGLARAEDAPPPRRPPPTDVKKDQVTPRIEKAKQLVKELEELVAKAKAAQPIDAVLLQKLMAMLDEAKALAQPVKPEELTAEEKKAVLDEAKKDEPAAPKDPAGDWQEKAIARAFDGADLSEEETIKAKSIVGDWYKESMASMGDSKKQSDLKRKRDDDLEKAVGKKKSQKIINNLNSMGPGRR